MSREVNGYYAFGGGSLDGHALQNTLNVPTEYAMRSISYAASGGGVSTVGKAGVLVGAELQAIVDQDAGGEYDTAIGVGYGLFNLGYCFRLGNVCIFPMIGLGGGGLSLDITEHPTDADVRISRANFLMHIGLGADWRLGERIGFIVGIRVGYVFAPFSQRGGIRGPYFRLIFGGGGRI